MVRRCQEGRQRGCGSELYEAIENGVNGEALDSDFRKRREESLLSKKTLQRYIQMCDEVISSKDTTKAKELQDEILASLCNDIAHLKSGLTNYSFVGAFTSGSTGHTTIVGDDVDYIKDAKLLKSKLMVEYEKIGDTMENLQDQESAEKVHKLFISHSSEDKAYMDALVEMLEDIGMPDGSMVCTSVPGHGIPGGAKIYDWLRDQFLNCDLRVLFALSANYYNSAACLNEMGAAWVTKSTDTIMLLPGFSFGEIKGCVDPREIGISFGSDEAELKHRLNELKDTLLIEHSLPNITQARWERIRDRFIGAVSRIAVEKEASEQTEQESVAKHTPIEAKDDVGSIPVDSAFLLVYAAAYDSQIMRIQVLGSPVQISVAGKQIMADNSPRESARWQEALDRLISWGWVKPVGSKGQVFELTGTGYNKADWLKEGMEINTDNEPLDELKAFERNSGVRPQKKRINKL